MRGFPPPVAAVYDRRLSIPEKCHNISRWLSEATPPVSHWSASDPGQGSHRVAPLAGVLFLRNVFRRCRPLRAQPPARIVASLRLACRRVNFCGNIKLSGPLWERRFLSLAALLLLTISAHADITGTVTLSGKPNSQDETFVAKANGCGESPVRKTENWKIGSKGELGDVVVWIVDPKGFPSDQFTRVISVKQLGCRYIPHVIAVTAGVPFPIINADPTLHNIRAKIYNGAGKPPGDDVFNFGQMVQGQTDEKQFDDPGIYTLQCDVHAWMQCWVIVLKNPCFDVTALDGKFNFPSLFDGDYKIYAWHPRFAEKLEQTIHVKNRMASVNFVFDGAKSF
jgi:plastocyanin